MRSDLANPNPNVGVAFRLESDVDRVELFRLTEIFRRRVDDIVIDVFNSDFKLFDNASEFSVSSLYVVFILSSKVMLIFLLYDKSSVGGHLATIDMGPREGQNWGCCAPPPLGASRVPI